MHNSICNVELNCANAQMRNYHFSPSNNHYLYNIASLTRRNPLPSASHVPASASDVNRIKKQDPSPPFTFCSFQPLDILLSSFHWPTSSLPLLIFTFSSLSDHPGVVFLQLCYLNTTEWVCSFYPQTVPSENHNLRKCISNYLIHRFQLINLKAQSSSHSTENVSLTFQL